VLRFFKTTKDAVDISHFSSLGRGDFAHYMLGRNWLPSSATEDALTEMWLRSLQEYSTETELDMLRIDEKTRAAWNDLGVLPKLKYVGLISVATFMPLVTVLFAPIDWGSSTLLFLASGKELLAAAGLSYLGNMATVQALTRELEGQVAIPQLSNLYAGLQDGLGLSRDASVEMKRMESDKRIRLSTAKIALKPALIPTLQPPVIEIDSRLLEQTQQRFSQLLEQLRDLAE
jgi:hypothetical protein